MGASFLSSMTPGLRSCLVVNTGRDGVSDAISPELMRDMMHRSLLPSLLLLPLCAWAQTQSKEVSLPERLESLVNDRFEATRCPGLSVAVASHNQIVFSKALGKADIEQDVRLTTASVQRLASLSKPITGTIIMDLVEQGKMAPDASVRQYLPELPAFYQSVTLRELLSHQSGVRGYGDEEAVLFSTAHYSSARDALKVMMTYPLAFTPGTKLEYSSLAFTVLGAAAEAVTGRSFQQLSMDFFSKHGISGFALDDAYAIVPRRVHGYLVDRSLNLQFNDGRVAGRDYLKGTNGEITNAHYYDISNRYPAGGFDVSAEDFLHFVIAVGSGKILKSDTVDGMWTAQRTSEGTTTVFGLGWGVSKYKEKTKMVGMNGLELSTAAFLRYLPDSGAGVVLLCNAEGAKRLPELVNDILDATVP
jgi:CubicO group peptidase (beta-lactamase class C family)